MKHLLLFYDCTAQPVRGTREQCDAPDYLERRADHRAAHSAAIAETFARADPYVVNGLVQHWHVREWSTVVGEEAATPAWSL